MISSSADPFADQTRPIADLLAGAIAKWPTAIQDAANRDGRTDDQGRWQCTRRGLHSHMQCPYWVHAATVTEQHVRIMTHVVAHHAYALLFPVPDMCTPLNVPNGPGPQQVSTLRMPADRVQWRYAAEEAELAIIGRPESRLILHEYELVLPRPPTLADSDYTPLVSEHELQLHRVQMFGELGQTTMHHGGYCQSILAHAVRCGWHIASSTWHQSRLRGPLNDNIAPIGSVAPSAPPAADVNDVARSFITDHDAAHRLYDRLFPSGVMEQQALLREAALGQDVERFICHACRTVYAAKELLRQHETSGGPQGGPVYCTNHEAHQRQSNFSVRHHDQLGQVYWRTDPSDFRPYASALSASGNALFWKPASAALPAQSGRLLSAPDHEGNHVQWNPANHAQWLDHHLKAPPALPDFILAPRGTFHSTEHIFTPTAYGSSNTPTTRWQWHHAVVNGERGQVATHPTTGQIRFQPGVPLALPQGITGEPVHVDHIAHVPLWHRQPPRPQ